MFSRTIARLTTIAAVCALTMGLFTGVSRADWPYPVYALTTEMDQTLGQDQSTIAEFALDGRFILGGAFNQDTDKYGFNAYQVDWLEQQTAAQVVYVGSRNDDGAFRVAGWLILTYVHRT